MWEVFDPRDGAAIFTVPWRWVARLLAWLIEGDYARPGDGWDFARDEE